MPIEPRTMTLNDLLKVISATKAYKYVDSNIDLDNGDLKLHKIGIMPIDCFGQLFIKTLYNWLSFGELSARFWPKLKTGSLLHYSTQSVLIQLQNYLVSTVLYGFCVLYFKMARAYIVNV